MSGFDDDRFFEKGLPKDSRDHVTPRKEFGLPHPDGPSALPASVEDLGLAKGENLHYSSPRQHTGVACATTGTHKLRREYFDIEIISTPRETPVGDEDSGKFLRYHIIHFNPRNPHVNAEVQETMRRACEMVLTSQLRVGPGHQDWSLDWVGTEGGLGGMGLNSFCLMISGLESDPYADRLLAAIAVRVDAVFGRLGGSKIIVPF